MPAPGSVEVENGQATLADALGQHARWGGLLLASLYTAGVLIVNLDLAKHGLFNADLARPEYVMSGALWAVLAGSSAWVMQFVVGEIREMRGSHRRWWRKVVRAILLPTILVTPAVALLPAIQFRPGGSRWYYWAGVGIVALNGLPLYLVPWAVREALADRRGVVTATLQIIPLVLLAVGAYSAAVSPYVPRQFGGTQKPTIELVLKQPALAGVVAGFPTSGVRIGPVKLLFETEKSYVVTAVAAPGTAPSWSAWVPADTPAVAIEREAVSVVIYHPPPKPGAKKE